MRALLGTSVVFGLLLLCAPALADPWTYHSTTSFGPFTGEAHHGGYHAWATIRGTSAIYGIWVGPVFIVERCDVVWQMDTRAKADSPHWSRWWMSESVHGRHDGDSDYGPWAAWDRRASWTSEPQSYLPGTEQTHSAYSRAEGSRQFDPTHYNAEVSRAYTHACPIQLG